MASPEVQARLQEVDATGQRNLEAINARIQSHVPRFNGEMVALVNSTDAIERKIPAFWQLVDEIGAFNEGNVACRRGCSHCCHIAVLLTVEEAQVIGRRIGRPPAHAPPRTDADDFDYGYHSPCTFLVDGECSIYENRPLACRVHYSLDVDALLCELTPPEPKPVPFMNDLPFMMAFLQMLGMPQRVPVLGEIRDFWPTRG
jgi:hypothetical protein